MGTNTPPEPTVTYVEIVKSEPNPEPTVTYVEIVKSEPNPELERTNRVQFIF